VPREASSESTRGSSESRSLSNMMTPIDDLDKSARSNPKSKSTAKSTDFGSYVRRFDIYTKLQEEYRVQTSSGATLSIIGWIVMGILILGEFNNYLTPTIKEHMVVDTTLGQQLRVNVNISFHALTCNEVHLDAMDVAGNDNHCISASLQFIHILCREYSFFVHKRIH
jgi:Endoplasmic Reticulum-Golgi Intermediate Compartment (ERGIC)